ncbi:MAG: DUF4838 domain-containing protein [Cytophagales bacterium]|nr:DUF4838 domain-containing protein [Cytophagales bacterium]
MKTKIKSLTYLTIAFIAMALFFASCQSDSVTVCRNGKAVSRIVIPSNPTEVERHSSIVLQNYLKQITGAGFEIVSDDKPAKNNDINLGKVNRPETDEIDFAELEEDGFVILTKNGRLTIAGGSEKGTLYGVYNFLEKYLDCRKYTSKISVIPARFNIAVNNINDKEIPVFQFREVLYRDAYNPEYMEWHGLDNHGSYNQKGDWGLWCHTTHRLVPPQDYCASHPEYYSMINGKRLCSAEEHNVGDICFSSEGALDVAYKNLMELMDEKPELTYWSVSQMDNAQYCQCPKCHTAYEESGSTQGTILPFVNKMAKRFPDKIISTLSYWYSTRPPKGIKPEKNVNILLCNIGSPRHIPIEEGDSTFCADLEAWRKIHDNFLIWDYVIQFSNLIAPFPNLRTLQPNLQYLHKNGVTAVFEQANRETGGEFCELKAYIFAKLMWDPYQDLDAVIDDFLNGYYGYAGKYIREYIDLMHNTMEKTGAKLNIFGRPWDNRNTFLTEEMIDKYYAIFDKAEEAVKDYPDQQFRVKTVRMQIDYAVLDIAKEEVTGKRGALEEKDGKLEPKREIKDLLKSVIALCDLNGVTRIHEWHTPPREYMKKYNEFLEENCK